MTKSGWLVALAASVIALAATAALAQGDAAMGERVFKKCKACHTVEEGGKNKVGPGGARPIPSPHAGVSAHRSPSPRAAIDSLIRASRISPRPRT